MKQPLLLLLFLLLAACSSKKTKEHADKPAYDCYDFYFYECTGDNMFIKIDNVEHTIHFSESMSDKNALSSLMSLKWNVLYPNSKANIKIYGQYSKHDSGFALIHWWLKAPFTLHSYAGDPDDPIEKGPLVQKQKLTAEDFETKLDTNPEIYNTALPATKP